MRFSSKGFANLASTTVIGTPFFNKFSAAFKVSFSLAPKLRIANFFPSLIIFDFPISIFSFIEGKIEPNPVPRGTGLGSILPSINEKIEIGKSKIIKEGKKLAILNFGARLNETLKAAENLLKKGVPITVVDARFAKPLDENLIWQLATTHEL